jgi:IS4 transposase
MRFEYYVEKVDDELYPYNLIVRAETGQYIGYQLTAHWRKRLETDYMTLEYLIYRLGENLKYIIEKETVA